MVNKKILALLLGLLVAALFISHGCAAARKPAPPDEPIPNKTRADDMDREKARHIADRVASVQGVRDATVVVAGRKAYIGLDVQQGMSEEQLHEIENIVADRVKGTEDDLDTVYVSSDPDMVTRLNSIARGLERGDSVTRYARELTAIGNSIKPRNI